VIGSPEEKSLLVELNFPQMVEVLENTNITLTKWMKENTL
jgi:hypothetical protein